VAGAAAVGAAAEGDVVAAGVAGAAGEVLAGRATELLFVPKRLACANVGTVMDAIVIAMTAAAVLRKEFERII
jgi:hypothetical protein